MSAVGSNYGMELDMEIESTIARLNQSNEGFTYAQPGPFVNTYRCFTGGSYIDEEGRRIELMSRWKQSIRLSKIVLHSLLRQPRPEPIPIYESVSLTIDDPYRRIGRICSWDFLSVGGGKSLMEGVMVMDEINEDYYHLSDISNSPVPFDRHDYHEAMSWTPGTSELGDYQPDDARELEQSLVQVVQRGTDIGWQTLWK